MTDPEHVRSRRRGNWAWGVAWVLALASVVYIWSVLHTEPRWAELTANAGSAPTANDLRAIDAYRAFVASSGLSPDLSHEYTASGIEHLSDAIRAVAEVHRVRNATLVEQRETFQRQADALRANPRARNHADIVRDVFNSAVDTLEYLQGARDLRSTGLPARLSELRQLALDIDAREPLLQQQVRVRRFFEGSSDALRTLAG